MKFVVYRDVMSNSHNFETDANGYIELKEEVA